MVKIQTHAIRALDELGTPYQVVMHAHKAKNVEEAAAERGVPEMLLVAARTRREYARAVEALVDQAPDILGKGGRHRPASWCSCAL